MAYDFGLLLKELRTQKGYSQAKLAKKLNKSTTIISKYECNNKRPSVETLMDMAVLFNCSLDYLLGLDKKESLSIETSVYKGYKQDKIEMRGDRAEMSDFPLYLNTVAGGLDCRDQTIGGFSFVVKIYAVPVVEIIG